MVTSRCPAFPGRRRHRGRHNCSTDPQPQPPCCPASQEPSPNGDREMGLLSPGAAVEVRLDGNGYYGLWFEATVTDFTTAQGRHATPRYSITFNGDNDIRWFATTRVRPRPPSLEPPPHFHPHDVVEVFHERGWWSGLVLSADTRSVTVAFPITREVITYMPKFVRPRRDYVDGEWVPSQAVVTIRPKHKIRRYEVMEEVEVVREREAYGDSWFPAKVAKVIDEFSYTVEYSNQNGEEGGSSEYLHWPFIRPVMHQHLPPENEFRLQLGPGVAVEVYCDGAWSAGRVHRIHEDGKCEVLIKGKHGKQVKVMTKEVKPRYKWDGKDWKIWSAKRQTNFKQEHANGKRAKSHVDVPFNSDEHIRDAEYSCAKKSRRANKKMAVLVQDSENASVSKLGTSLTASEICLTNTCPPNSCFPLYGHSAHRKIVVSDNVQNQLERKKGIQRKVCSTKKRHSNKKQGFQGPHSLHGPLELSSTGQKIRMNEIAGSQREPSLVLERSESTQQQLDSILENAVNQNEVKYLEPDGVVPLSIAATSDGNGIYGRKFDEGLTAQDNRITHVLANNSQTQAPTVSSLLSAVEDMDVLKEFPQQPHFLPLQKFPETIQKGMKLGLKVAFNDCVGRIRKSSIADNEISFEEKKRTLSELRQIGFDVEYVEGVLDKLIEVKVEYSKHLEEKSAVQTQKKQIESSSDKKYLLLNKDKVIGELEKKLGLLRQEGQLIAKEKECDEENVSILGVAERNIDEALDDDIRKFNGILAEAQQKHLT